MSYQYTPYIWPLLISSGTTAFLGLFALIRRRRSKAATAFILSMAILSVWALFNALEMSAAELKTKLLWANLQYFSYCYSPVTLFSLCAEFTGYGSFMKNRRFLWITVLPTIIFALVWTDGSLGLVRYGFQLSFGGAFPVIAKHYGPLFYVHAAYSFALNFSAWFLLARALFSRSALYRKQTLSLFLGLNLIIIPNILYVSHLIPLYRFDITPALFGPAGVLVAWGIFRQKLFDVIPLAWATVVRNIEAGILVLDPQGRVLDLNPACERLLECCASQAVMRPGKEVCGTIPALAAAISAQNGSPVEFSLGEGDAERVYAAEIWPIVDKGGKVVGKLVMVGNVTEKKRRQQELMDRQRALAVEEERARTARDLHDNLGQILGFINIQAQGIRYELEQAGVTTVSGRLDKLVSVTQEAHAELRQYIRGIRDPDCGNDLFPAINRYLNSFEERTGITVKRNFFGRCAGELDPHFRFNIQYIIREALNNVEKHAAASHITVSLSFSEEMLSVFIQDDGKGFTQESAQCAGAERFGLGIMRERAKELKGELKIESHPGEGCRVTLCVPVKGGRANEITAG